MSTINGSEKEEHIKFKLCILGHKCLNNSAPRHLADKMRSLSDDSNRSRSSDGFGTKTKRR